jgi:hypothetical protein
MFDSQGTLALAYARGPATIREAFELIRIRAKTQNTKTLRDRLDEYFKACKQIFAN